MTDPRPLTPISAALLWRCHTPPRPRRALQPSPLTGEEALKKLLGVEEDDEATDASAGGDEVPDK